MSNETPALRRPRSDDRAVWDVIFGFCGYPAVLAAFRLGLFEALAQRPLTLAEACQRFNIKPRPADALLAICASLGFVTLTGERYGLTAVAEDYLLQSSPTFFGGILDVFIDNAATWSIETITKAVLTDQPQVYGGADWTRKHEEQAELARRFTRGMHSSSTAPGLAWPDSVNLSKARTMLDVGGGSGAHSIGAALRWPALQAIIFDIPPVCEVAREFIALQGLEDRIRPHAGDFWNDPFPEADVHFYGMIYHDWAPDQCRFLTGKSFKALPPGGRIIIHEMLFNDQRTGPFPIAAFNIDMLVWDPGQQYSGRELAEMLTDAGFVDIQAKQTFGYWSIVTGRKP